MVGVYIHEILARKRIDMKTMTSSPSRELYSGFEKMADGNMLYLILLANLFGAYLTLFNQNEVVYRFQIRITGNAENIAAVSLSRISFNLRHTMSLTGF